MLPATWKPIPARLIRVGNDGGYLASPEAVEASTLLLGLGVNDDWSFGEQFRRFNPVRTICFDRTIDSRLWIGVFLRGIVALEISLTRSDLVQAGRSAAHAPNDPRAPEIELVCA